MTALHVAAKNNNWDAVNHLLARGADKTIRDGALIGMHAPTRTFACIRFLIATMNQTRAWHMHAIRSLSLSLANLTLVLTHARAECKGAGKLAVDLCRAMAVRELLSDSDGAAQARAP